MQGWIKTHRSLLTSNIFRNEKLLKVFMWCLLKASHTEHEQVVGRQTIKVEPGQLVFGRKSAALELNMKESSVYDYMKLLEKSETIHVKSNNKFSVVTVVNWAFYQGADDSEQQQINNKSTTNQQQIDTNKNGNNGLNGENSKNPSLSGEPSKTKYPPDSTYMKMAEYLLSRIKAWKPDFVFRGNMQTWANECRLLLEVDKRSKEDIKAVIDFATSDPFWQSNILSTAKLRKQFDTLQGRMKNARPPQQQQGSLLDQPNSPEEPSYLEKMERMIRGE